MAAAPYVASGISGNGHRTIPFEPLVISHTPTLVNLPELPPIPEALVPGLFGSRVGILYASLGMKKSFLCKQLATALATGGHFLGRKLRQRGVLYLDLEGDDKLFLHQIRQQNGGNPLPADTPLYHGFRCPVLNEEGIAHLIGALAEHPDVSVCIIDPLTWLMPQVSNGNISLEYRTFTGRVLRRIYEETGVDIPGTWNTSKGKKEDPAERISGPMGLLDGTDYALYLHGNRGEPTATLKVIKSRLPHEPEVRLTWEEERALWHLAAEDPGNGAPAGPGRLPPCPACGGPVPEARRGRGTCSARCSKTLRQRRYRDTKHLKPYPCDTPSQPVTLQENIPLDPSTDPSTTEPIDPAEPDARQSLRSPSRQEHKVRVSCTETIVPEPPQDAPGGPPRDPAGVGAGHTGRRPARPAQARREAPLGVLAAEGLYSPGVTGPVPWGIPVTLGACLNLAQEADVAHLWLHASALPADCSSASEQWMQAPGWSNVKEVGKKWLWRAHSARGGRVLHVGVPAWNTGPGEWSAWKEAPTGRMLYLGLQRFHEHLGIIPQAGPGSTARALLRSLHAGPAGLLIQPAIFPQEIARYPARPMIWHRALTEEERGRRALVSFDRRGQYLGTMSSLRLGLEEPRHIHGPNITWFKKAEPGFWRAKVRPPDEPPGPLLPPPFEIGGLRWYSTPALELLASLAYRIEHIEEAWFFKRSGRPLEPFYTLLRDARHALRIPAADASHEAALAAVKDMYGQFIGHLCSTLWDRSGDPTYRPDWSAFIIEQARANLWRIIARAAAEGYYPVLVYIDEVVFATDAAGWQDAMPPRWRRLTNLGAFDHKHTAALAGLRDTWDPALTTETLLSRFHATEAP